MEITPGIHSVDQVRGANSYLVLGGEGGVVVDTGMAGNEGRIVEYSERVGVEPTAIKYIVLTHPDADHSGSVAKLKGLTGAKVAIHEDDAPRLSGEKKLKEVKGAAGVLFGLLSPLMRVTPVKADLLLREGDTISDLRVVHTPGHTAGSICLYRENVAIFVGDALRTDSQGRPRLPPASMTVDMQQARESVRKIAGYQYAYLLPGHGSPMAKDASKVMADFAAKEL